MTTHLDAARAAWTRMGAADAPFAILTEEGKQGGAWDLNEFWSRGRNDVRHHMDVLEDAVIAAGLAMPPDDAVALDFGCGIGRLSRALKGDWGFAQVIGLDFADSMIEQARQHDEAGTVDFRVNPGPGIDLDDAGVDLVLTLITLQHVETELQHGYLREFLRVLRPGGYAIVGMMAAPIRPPRPHEIGDYAASAPFTMEMHGVDVQAAIRTFRLAGGRVLDVRLDPGQSAWSDVWAGFTYYVEKLGEG